MILPLLVLPALLSHAPLPSVAGTWKLASAPDLADGIRRATAGLPNGEQSRMQARLQSVNPIYRELLVKTEGPSLTVAFDQRHPLVMLAGETRTWTREDGQTFFVTAHLDGQRLVQTIKSGDGTRVNEFVPGGDGRSLTLLVTITSHEVPGVLRYRMLYTAQ
ncbi:MAG TPA: hypothetical protein VJ483_04730 [Holophagaceae bacterium]|nr:hypothetical protein [Holophagaceae bacterium]